MTLRTLRATLRAAYGLTLRAAYGLTLRAAPGLALRAAYGLTLRAAYRLTPLSYSTALAQRFVKSHCLGACALRFSSTTRLKYSWVAFFCYPDFLSTAILVTQILILLKHFGPLKFLPAGNFWPPKFFRVVLEDACETVLPSFFFQVSWAPECQGCIVAAL